MRIRQVKFHKEVKVLNGGPNGGEPRTQVGIVNGATYPGMEGKKLTLGMVGDFIALHVPGQPGKLYPASACEFVEVEEEDLLEVLTEREAPQKKKA